MSVCEMIIPLLNMDELRLPNGDDGSFKLFLLIYSPEYLLTIAIHFFFYLNVFYSLSSIFHEDHCSIFDFKNSLKNNVSCLAKDIITHT